MQCAPAFNYARDSHNTTIVDDTSIPNAQQTKILFESENLTLDLRYIIEATGETSHVPTIELSTLDLTSKGHKGPAGYASIQLSEGQAVTFVLRTPPSEPDDKTDLERNLTLVGPLGINPRTFEDPFLTKVKYFLQLFRRMSWPPSWSGVASVFVICQSLGVLMLGLYWSRSSRSQIGIGMSGSLIPHTPGRGRRQSFAVPWLWSFWSTNLQVKTMSFIPSSHS